MKWVGSVAVSRGRVGLASALAAALLAGSIAALEAGAATQSSSKVVTGGSTESATVRCPPGQRLTGVGFETKTDPGNGFLIKSLVPLARKARGSVVGLSPPPTSGYFDLYGDCARRPARPRLRATRVVRATTSVAPGTEGFASARCPRPLTVRTAGFVSDLSATNRSSVSHLSRPAPRRVRAGAINSDVVVRSITAVALCGRGPSLRSFAATDTQAADPAEASALARCGGGRKLAFGGFDTNSTPTDRVFIREMRRVGTRSLRASTFSFDPNSQVTAIAYCRR